MYRNENWAEGYYIENHEKYECNDCGKTFIVGVESLSDCPPGYPMCPYCGQHNVERIVWTDDENLEELADGMGCLAIYADY
ncbi:MAG: hypothetical protein E6357_26365 [Clostridiales bacterium]|nr:hypothetical protein [Clostridiales bacterium]